MTLLPPRTLFLYILLTIYMGWDIERNSSTFHVRFAHQGWENGTVPWQWEDPFFFVEELFFIWSYGGWKPLSEGMERIRGERVRLIQRMINPTRARVNPTREKRKLNSIFSLNSFLENYKRTQRIFLSLCISFSSMLITRSFSCTSLIINMISLLLFFVGSTLWERKKNIYIYKKNVFFSHFSLLSLKENVRKKIYFSSW